MGARLDPRALTRELLAFRTINPPGMERTCARGPGLVLVITAGEEIGCEGAKFLADRKLLERAGAIVIAEPTANEPYVGHKGLAWFEVKTTGVTAHGSMPELGDNAILKMAR